MISDKSSEEEKEINAEEVVKQSLLAKAEISLLLDTYDDIFSDFDPRPFPQRALSDDFLLEAKKAARDKGDNLDLSFMIPKAKRNFEHEVLIKRRLREHFRKHTIIIENEVKSIRRKGVVMAITGIILIMVATYFFSLASENIFIHLLIVILEPAGWFTAWTGLDEIYYTAKQQMPDLEFYQKMTKSEISFHQY